MYNRFDRIPACADRLTDGQTDGLCDGIVRAVDSIAR